MSSTKKASPVKKAPAKKDISAYTSVYLDKETREALAKLATASGTSRSQVITALIRGAAEPTKTDMRVMELANELSALVLGRLGS